ncbi:MAG: hypothetical protein A2571_01580 [Candidatus Vogelbacteria bacterium RIFOXYD1_FULL_44_32]|uniref:Uncharacterized protein n=1 Tax=Candidatus Vogelbacteria bacterium RIFOXYD1_FULL_44_32 TaxID=1802438 RepID=A0A1G2QEM2_9BACT|nr:MAG: hypothetical protein A2571_01580 [Candidatus Vogelbacteria bacterium RIFOXYD1_FULL_44_32]
MKNNITIKLLIVGIIMLLCYVAGLFVYDVVSDRDPVVKYVSNSRESGNIKKWVDDGWIKAGRTIL